MKGLRQICFSSQPDHDPLSFDISHHSAAITAQPHPTTELSKSLTSKVKYVYDRFCTIFVFVVSTKFRKYFVYIP